MTILERFTERIKSVQVEETLRYFMASFAPKHIYELEKQLGYSWQNLQPFYVLCESLVPEVYQMGAFCMEFLSWDGTLHISTGFFLHNQSYYSTRSAFNILILFDNIIK